MPEAEAAPVIDFHIHHTPESLIAARGALGSKRVVEYVEGVPAYTHHAGLADIDRHVAVMDEAGIDIAFLSSGAGLESPIDACRTVNDGLAEAARRHPGRIEGMAHAPAFGGEEALAELDRACGELGFRAVAVASTIQGRTLDDPGLQPFLERVEGLGAFLFVHPALSIPSLGLQAFDRFDLYRMVGREFDLQLAALRLILGGVLDRHPSLRVVISHLAGGLSAVWGRVRPYQDKAFWGIEDDPEHNPTAADPVDAYLGRLFFDTGGFFGDMTAIDAALLNIPAGQIVFGTDYPQEIREAEGMRGFVQRLEARGEVGEAILRGNAARLLDPSTAGAVR